MGTLQWHLDQIWRYMPWKEKAVMSQKVHLIQIIPDRGEIIWINYNPQSGREMKDMHPMLVLSPKKFNDRTGIVIGLPMTTAEYNHSNPFAVKFMGPRGIDSYVLAHKPKSFDWRKRNAKAHPWKRAPTDVLITVCELLNQIILLDE